MCTEATCVHVSQWHAVHTCMYLSQEHGMACHSTNLNRFPSLRNSISFFLLDVSSTHNTVCLTNSQGALDCMRERESCTCTYMYLVGTPTYNAMYCTCIHVLHVRFIQYQYSQHHTHMALHVVHVLTRETMVK
jgi:hypothetical protein